jgi:AAHS family 4-hydroxybenzoate transporter-like MFS transporter
MCSLVAFLDGFDTQSIGPAGSAIAAQVGIKLGELGPVFSASQLGFLVGALAFSALGDRIGRKRMLVVATVIFAGCTLGTATSESYAALLSWRFLTGLGLGGATPNFISLASEFSRPTQRARVVTTMWAAVPFGGMVGSFTSAWVIPRFGWHMVFLIGTAAPVILLPVLIAAMPESKEILLRPAQSVPIALRRASPVTELFTGGRTQRTLLLWATSFMTWLMLVVMAFWTPPLLQKTGMSTPHAAEILAFINAGGVVGTVVIGTVLGRVRPERALIVVFLASAMFIAAIGMSLSSFSELVLCALFAGFFSSAAGGGLIAVAAYAYPPEARATGVGWALGLGRAGSMLGPLGTGLLVAQGWPVSHIYFAIACPAVFAAVLTVLLARQMATVHAPHEPLTVSI